MIWLIILMLLVTLYLTWDIVSPILKNLFSTFSILIPEFKPKPKRKKRSAGKVIDFVQRKRWE